MIKRIFILCFFVSVAQAQQDNSLSTKLGIQFKPILASAYFNASSIAENIDDFNFTLAPKQSYSLGMIVRKEVNKTFAVEYGINYIQQNFTLDVSNNIHNISDVTNFGIRSYELPLQGLVYVKISPKIYLNAAFGFSYIVYASDVFSEGNNNNRFFQNTYRRKRHQSALIANIGSEYRTNNNGYYYIGFSLHRPWKDIARVYPEYDFIGNEDFNDNAPGNDAFYIEILGNFLTLDLRYFF